MDIEIVNSIRIKWYIEGFDNYAFGEDKKLYNIQRGKEINEKVNGGSMGWWLGRKFMIKSRLEPLIRKDKYFDVPF
jgi:hypothetical protein